MEPLYSHSCLFIQCSLMLFIVSSSCGMWLVLLNCLPFCFASLVKQVNYFVRPFGPWRHWVFYFPWIAYSIYAVLAVRRNTMGVKYYGLCNTSCFGKWTSKYSWYQNGYSSSGFSITLLVCEMSAIVQQFEHSLALPFFGIGMKIDLFQSCGHCWVFQICWHFECSTSTVSSFRI